MSFIHTRIERMMAAEYLCMVAGMGTSEKDLQATAGMVVGALDGCPPMLDHAVRYAGDSQRKRIIAAIEIIRGRRDNT